MPNISSGGVILIDSSSLAPKDLVESIAAPAFCREIGGKGRIFSGIVDLVS